MHMRTGLVAMVALLALLAAGCGATADAGGGGTGDGTGGDGAADITTAPAPPDAAPYIRGAIASVAPTTPVTENCGPADPDGDGAVSSDDPPVCNPNPDVWGSFQIVGNAAHKGEPEATTTVGKGTPIVRKTKDGSLEAATFQDLRGAKDVSVWITGAVAESFPVQVTASYVLLNG